MVVLLAIAAAYLLQSSSPLSQQQTSSSSNMSVSSASMASQSSQSSSSSGGSLQSQSSTTSSSFPQVSLSALQLFSGTATTPTFQGKASIYFVLQNPGPQTGISSIVISGSSVLGVPATYRCSSPTSCSVTVSALVRPPVVSGNSTTSFTTPTTGFYFGSALTSNQSYDYSITLTNGQTLSGTATAA